MFGTGNSWEGAVEYRTKKRISIAFALALVIALAVSLCVLLGGNRTMRYAPGDRALANPDRGFYVQTDGSDPDVIGENRDSARLFLLAFDLYAYRDCAIPEEKLEELERFLAEAEAQDAACIFRAGYGFEQMESNDADSLERVAGHIAQIAPVLNRHKAQILCVQAGFFGPWGEWHSSRYLPEENDAAAAENRLWLLRELLSQLDGELVVDLRRPRFIREAVAEGLPIERLGFHDDGLLASDSDFGTYDDPAYSREEELRWMEENLVTGANGGEMPAVSNYSDAKNAAREFRMMKLSYLNLDYNRDVYASWTGVTIDGQDALEYMERHMGYRLYLAGLSCPRKLNGIFGRTLTLTLKNDGFAPIGRDYCVEWAVEDKDGAVSFFDAPCALPTLGSGDSLTIELPLERLEGMDVWHIGIRISHGGDGEKRIRNCVELANDGTAYNGGVNYFLRCDENGRLTAFG